MRRARLRRLLVGLLAAPFAWAAPPVHAQANEDFPQLKLNHIDTSEAPTIRVYFSILSRSLRSATLDNLSEVTLYRKPDKGKAEELFSFEAGELKWPKSMSDEEIKAKEDTPPELLHAVDLDKGAAVVVVVPGFQDPEYFDGTLGERSRNGAGLFFKKLGKNNKANVVWYSDDISTYVYTQGRTARLTRLQSQLDACAKWDRDKAERYGLDEEEEEAEGPRKGQAECGLTAEYGEFASYIAKQPYQGFWPQLFGIRPAVCAAVKEGEKPSWVTRGVARGGGGSGEQGPALVNPDGLTAFEVALEMLVEGGEPGQQRILILTGDGRDGYINRFDDCRVKYTNECKETPEVMALRGIKRNKALDGCVDKMLRTQRTAEQEQFAKKLDRWLGLAKAANVRIFSVVHPTAQKYTSDRLEVLAWRTGGTARVAEDAEDVITQYENLIGELNNQFVVTFVDDDAVPGAELQYTVEAKVSSQPFRRVKPYTETVAAVVDKPLLAEIEETGTSKLGKAGFLAVVIGVGLLLLLILVKVFRKILSKGGGAAKKAAKGGAKGAKAKAKLKEKAKKKAMKQAKAKAKAKAKLKKKMKG